ncbi:iron ABC transporter permease [Microbacterium sp. CFBP 8790]|uniref:FecCD family ABC transporter permease n=1 Tax=Microbacterium sp. CFBP 8801 TaxID=2774036 RepID=UPI00177CC1D8|nr:MULTISPECIES: iron ABC transporter permease [unclassified Microbacterium]MBD8207915.1 iron ABC transporter permease [Microbacterium sp. CFBP 8801]MBD8478055.1 iron ABC transporter permease [Microbacterium sp. CFBP 8794]MBD8508684.1 iron ABC transporter permease [Microbacterium sp. CFBP 8790]
MGCTWGRRTPRRSRRSRRPLILTPSSAGAAGFARTAKPRRSLAAWLVSLAIATVVASVFAVMIGSVYLSPSVVIGTVVGNLTGDLSAVDPLDQKIVWQLRVPRVLLAGVVGAGLSLAGAALQGLLRNPLADPYIIGVSSGASLGAVLVMTLGSGALLGLTTSTAAFAGAIAVLALVYAFAQRSGSFTDMRLVLSGVALGYVAMSGTSFAQLHAEPGEIRGMLFWMMGSVGGARWETLLIPAVTLVLAGGWLLTQARGLNALALGDDDAVAVGVDLRTFRLGLLLTSAVLTAVAVSVAGGVGFVGLIIPHAMRLIVGADYRRLLPVTAVAGALFLIIVDLIARTIGSPNEYPLTIFTALIGGPFFLWLMRSSGGRS